ncbi:hypothetical protein KM043_012918 [Ampulex compressa]|nr:hypothetical protein KM043_012918 [Ampulex compressa]
MLEEYEAVCKPDYCLRVDVNPGSANSRDPIKLNRTGDRSRAEVEERASDSSASKCRSSCAKQQFLRAFAMIPTPKEESS